MIRLSLAMALAGFALLAMAMHRHAGQTGITRWRESRRFWLQPAGWTALAMSLLPWLADPRWRIGIVAWVGQLTLCAAIVAIVLTYRPRILPAIAVLASLAAVVIAAYQSA